jgi:hypothetical protein
MIVPCTFDVSGNWPHVRDVRGCSRCPVENCSQICSGTGTARVGDAWPTETKSYCSLLTRTISGQSGSSLVSPVRLWRTADGGVSSRPRSHPRSGSFHTRLFSPRRLSPTPRYRHLTTWNPGSAGAVEGRKHGATALAGNNEAGLGKFSGFARVSHWLFERC